MKSFLNFNGETVMERNGVKLAFKPINQEKGSKGSFPGLLLSDFNLDKFIDWLPKNAEVDANNRLNSFITDSINELSQQVWKETVAEHDIEYTPTKGTTKPMVIVSPEVFKIRVESFLANLASVLNGESRAIKERDSKYFNDLFKATIKDYQKETDTTKKAALKLLAMQHKKTADELVKAEEKAMEELLLSMA